MIQKHILNLYFARTAGMLSGARRVAMLLAVMLLTMTAQTAWAQGVDSPEGEEGASPRGGLVKQKYENQFFNMGYLYELQSQLETMKDEQQNGKPVDANHLEVIRTNLPCTVAAFSDTVL